MKSERKGWVVINIGHPSSGKKYIVNSTFSETRAEAIAEFTEGSGSNWRYWRERYNFRVVKSTQAISVNPNE